MQICSCSSTIKTFFLSLNCIDISAENQLIMFGVISDFYHFFNNVLIYSSINTKPHDISIHFHIAQNIPSLISVHNLTNNNYFHTDKLTFM